MQGVSNISEFIDPALVPKKKVRVAAFDGENADPANGRSMGDGIFAHTPWGEIAYGLAGKVGYERIRRSDEQMVAPGAETIAELFGNEPTLILLDELSVYLRKAMKAAPGRWRSADGLPHLTVQGDRKLQSRRAGLYVGDWQRGPADGCLCFGEPVHRGSYGGG